MSLSQSKVLIVDDTPSNVLLLERMLEPSGVTTLGTSDPRETVPLLQSFRPDLVLLDLHMPVMDGFQVLERLRTVIRPTEFLPVMVLTGDTSVATKERALAAGANDFLSKPFELTELMLRVRNLLKTRSLYLALAEHTAALERQLEREADQRRHRARQSGTRTARIRAVLDGDLLHMHYQPIVALASRALLGAEALARFPTTPSRSPYKWFTEAAAVGLGVELEVAAVRVAVRGLDQLPADCYLSVNMSAEAVLTEPAQQVLAELPADRVVLELTGHAQAPNHASLAAALAPVRAAGLRLALDDAGGGFSTLRQLFELRPDIIKIGLALTRGIDGDTAQRSLAAALLKGAAELAADVVAEGIETEAELAVLRELGVGGGQGYLLGRPQELPLGLTRSADARRAPAADTEL